MVDAAALTLPDGPIALAGAVVAVTAPSLRLSLRGRDMATLARETGLNLPTRIGEFSDGVARLGPDEWFAILPTNTVVGMAPGQPVAIVDVSGRSLGISVAGPKVAELIGAGCPLDVARMTPGRATRTLFETVEIILIRENDQRFYIDVWRSFAPWLFGALVAAGAG